MEALRIEPIYKFALRAKLQLFVRLTRNRHFHRLVEQAIRSPPGMKWATKALLHAVKTATDAVPYAINKNESEIDALANCSMLNTISECQSRAEQNGERARQLCECLSNATDQGTRDRICN